MRILEGASREQIALVREGRLDVAFVLGAPDLPNCDVAQLWTEQIFVALPQVLAAVMNNTFFGDGLVKGGLDEMPSIGHRDTIPCMHSGESGKCGQPAL